MKEKERCKRMADVKIIKRIKAEKVLFAKT